MNTLNIRRARHEDALQIIDSHVRSIREVCGKDYSPEQIEAWAGRNFKPHLLCQTMDRDYVWIVENESQVLGYGHLAIMDANLGEVMGLYLAPEICGKGAGKKLFDVIKSEAVKNKLKELRLNATITAKPFYEKLGFIQIPGSCSVEMQGVQIPCFPMSKTLEYV